jgi:hypothetical protein
MKKFKNNFGVKGSLPLLMALKEEVEKLGWKYDNDFNPWGGDTDLYFNANRADDDMKTQHFSSSSVYRCTIYTLPQQWDECLKAASELEEVEPWTIGTYVVFLEEYGGNPKDTISNIVRTGKSTIETEATMFQTGETCCLFKDKECKWFPTLQEAKAFSKELLKVEPMEIAGYNVKFKEDKVSIGCYKDINLKDLKTIRKAIKVASKFGKDLTVTEDSIIDNTEDSAIFLDEIEQLIERLDG